MGGDDISYETKVKYFEVRTDDNSISGTRPGNKEQSESSQKLTTGARHCISYPILIHHREAIDSVTYFSVV